MKFEKLNSELFENSVDNKALRNVIGGATDASVVSGLASIVVGSDGTSGTDSAAMDTISASGEVIY